MHRVVAAQVAAKWLSGRVSQELLDHLAKQVSYQQRRNQQAWLSHVKRTRRALRAKGIRLTKMSRCQRLS